MGGRTRLLLAALFFAGALGISMVWQPSAARAQWGAYGYPYGQPWGGGFGNSGVVIQRGFGSGLSLNIGPGGVTLYRGGYLSPSNYPYYRSGYGSYYGNGLGYGSYYGSGYGSYYGSGYGSYYGSGYGSYYGNGSHDYQPHWHSTQTPYGSYNWYGNGPHDAAPHQHTVTPFGTQSYSQTQSGPTTSFNGVPAY